MRTNTNRNTQRPGNNRPSLPHPTPKSAERSHHIKPGKTGRKMSTTSRSSFPLHLKLIITGAACVIIVAMSFVLLTCNRFTPKSTVKSFLFCTRHSYVQGMIRCLTPTERAVAELLLQNTGTLKGDSELRKILSNFIEYDLYPNVDPVIEDVSKRGHSAVVKVSMNLNGDDVIFDFHLVKVRTQWYIQYIYPEE
jgi:hypothetical protein